MFRLVLLLYISHKSDNLLTLMSFQPHTTFS